MSQNDRRTKQAQSALPIIAVIGAFLLGALILLLLTGHSLRDYELRSPIVLKSEQDSTSGNGANAPAATGESATSGAATSTDGATGSASSSFVMTVAVGPEGTGSNISIASSGTQDGIAVSVPCASPCGAEGPAPMESADVAGSPEAGSVDWFDSDGWRFLGWIALLLAAAGLFWKIFGYLNESRNDYYSEHAKLVKAGWKPEPKAANVIATNDPIKGAISPADAQADPANAIQLGLTLTGPDKLQVGSTEIYQVSNPLGTPLPPNLQVFAKADGGDVQPYTLDPVSGKFAVQALKIGKATLHILFDGKETNGELAIQVMPAPDVAPSNSVPLLVFGTGSHTLILVTLVVFVLLMLTLSGAITGTAAAPLIGTLIGYLFGVNVKSDAGGEQAVPAKE